jgi:2-iminobutanoate/2-iminopropanoate deaminase
MRKAIHTSGAPKAIGPYSQAIQLDYWVYVSGQIPLDPESSEMIESDRIEDQTHRVMKNIEAILHAANSDFDKVIKFNIYLSDINDFPKVNETYQTYLKEPFPARATFEVANLPKSARIEIDCIAHV